MSQAYQMDTLKNLAKKDVPQGMRLCRIVFKGGEESKACFIPAMSEAKVQAFLNLPAGMEFVKECIEGLEDKAARAVWVGSKRSVCDSDLDLNSLALIAQATSTSTRLSKDSITEWFKRDGMVRVANLFIARGATVEQAQETAANYLPLFVRLAEKGQIAFTESVLTKFKRVVDLLFCESEDMFELKMLDAMERCFVPTEGNLGIDL